MSTGVCVCVPDPQHSRLDKKHEHPLYTPQRSCMMISHNQMSWPAAPPKEDGSYRIKALVKALQVHGYF